MLSLKNLNLTNQQIFLKVERYHKKMLQTDTNQPQLERFFVWQLFYFDILSIFPYLCILE